MNNIRSKKARQCPYKPGSVSFPKKGAHHLSNLQVTLQLKRSTLRRCASIGRATLITTVYMNLQPPDGTAWRSPVTR